MSTDLITEIQAQPREFAAKFETMRATLAAVTARLAAVTAERNTFKSACLQMDARDLKRAAAARKVAQWARGQAYELHISELCFAHAREDAETAEAERDAARREVARRTTIMQSTAQKAERWIHDTDQFSPRTSAEDMVVQDGQLEELAQIVKALRGDTAPAQPAACSKCGHPMANHDDVIGCFEYECECNITAPAGRE